MLHNTLNEPRIEFFARHAEDPVDVPFTVGTLAGFRAWAHSEDFPERGKALYFSGKVTVDMSPEDLEVHNKCKGALAAGWARFLDQHPVGEQIFDGALFVNEEADLATEPDAMICLYDSLRTGRVVYREVVEGSGRFVEVAGSPDIVAEVVSKSSVRKDTVELVDAYFRAGVQEYWRIDARKTEIEFCIFTRGAEAFVRTTADDAGFFASNILRSCFRMTRDRNPVGGWRYRLERGDFSGPPAT